MKTSQQRWLSTMRGYYLTTYYRIQQRCKGGMFKPFYKGMNYMSRSEWDVFLNVTMDIRRKLFNVYVRSGRQRRLAPSINRINSKLGYSFENCEWLPQWKNSALGGGHQNQVHWKTQPRSKEFGYFISPNPPDGGKK